MTVRLILIVSIGLGMIICMLTSFLLSNFFKINYRGVEKHSEIGRRIINVNAAISIVVGTLFSLLTIIALKLLAS